MNKINYSKNTWPGQVLTGKLQNFEDVDLDRELRRQFEQLGFRNFRSLKVRPFRPDDNGLVFKTTQERVIDPKGTGKFIVRFELGISYPEDNTPYFIQSLVASLSANFNSKPLCIMTMKKLPLNLPSKNSIIQNLFQYVNMQLIQERFKIGIELKRRTNPALGTVFRKR